MALLSFTGVVQTQRLLRKKDYQLRGKPRLTCGDHALLAGAHRHYQLSAEWQGSSNSCY